MALPHVPPRGSKKRGSKPHINYLSNFSFRRQFNCRRADHCDPGPGRAGIPGGGWDGHRSRALQARLGQIWATTTDCVIIYVGTSGGMASSGVAQSLSEASGETLVSAGVYRQTTRPLNQRVYLPVVFKGQ